MNIIITDISLLSVFIVPVVPVGLEIKSEGDNESIDSLSGKFNLIKYPKLRSIAWSSFFPVNKNYGFLPSGALLDGWLYIAFLELMKKYRLPIRIIITNSDKVPIFNSLVSIDTLTYKLDKAGDINYSIKVTEFPYNLIEFLKQNNEIDKYVTQHNITNFKSVILKENGLL